MSQQKLNAKVLAYLKARHGNPKYRYCTIDFIRREVIRNIDIEDYKLAEALKQAYYALQNFKTNKD